MKQILLATDGSNHATNAAKEVAKLAKGFSDLKVTIVTVVNSEQSKKEALDLRKDSELIHQERLNKIKNTIDTLEKDSVSYQVEFLHGEPAQSIVDYAKQHAFDMLVIGSRGLNSLQEMILGSVSHKVFKHAKCPVLIVK